MKRILYLIICMPLLLLSGCDVHEFPDNPATVKLHLRLNYESQITEWIHTYDGSKVTEQGTGATYNNALNYGSMRYIVRAYPIKNTRQVSQYYTHEYVFNKDVSKGYNHEATIDLTPGNYKIMVWSDLTYPNRDTYYYNPANFFEILLQGEYTGNTDYRDAFRGTNDATIISDYIERVPDTLDITMQRPLAKYSFITTDLKEFIDKEIEYLAKEAATRGETSPTRVNTDDYKVYLLFSGYMPSAYNMNADKPVDAEVGVLYKSKLNVLNEHEAELGYDYVFVGNNKSAVTVQLVLYDKNDRQLALSLPINVPLLRNHNTILKGSFIMEQASGGIKIDPSFNGNHNIIID